MTTSARRVIVLCTLLLGASLHASVQATEIYMWVDENGRVQLSDTVPDKYRASARKIDSQQFEVTPEQQAQARAKAEQDKRDAATLEAELADQKRRAAQPSGARPANASRRNAATDCASQQRAYVRSQECFAPYVMANGAIREEAFKRCTPVLDPSGKCGIQPIE